MTTKPPHELVEAMARAEADLSFAADLPIRLDIADPGPYANREVLATVLGTVTGLFIRPDATHEEMTVALADQLQEAVIEARQGAVPKCPMHEHPLTAKLLDGRAVWACPAPQTTWSCPIGDLSRCLATDRPRPS
jgi:hypothetical protein